jgi:hypothetical protein
MKLKFFSLLGVLFLCSTLYAQTNTTAPLPIFTLSSQAMAIGLAGQTTPATDIIGAFSVTNGLILQSDNILAPGINLQAYLGGARYNISLANIIAKTKIPPNTFQPYVHVGVGVIRNVPAQGNPTQHYTWMGGAGFDYDPQGTGKWSFGPRIEYFDAPGFGRSPRGITVSAQLSFVIGHK